LWVEGCHVVSVKDPYGRIFGFLDRKNGRTIVNMFDDHDDGLCDFMFSWQ
jgi:hypothetical protein